jgi:hypothetical protein
MVSLVKGNSYETWSVLRLFLLLQVLVPLSDRCASNWSHAFLRLKSGVKKPKAGYISGLRQKLIQSKDGGQDAANGKGFLGYVRRGYGMRFLQGIRRSHCCLGRIDRKCLSNNSGMLFERTHLAAARTEGACTDDPIGAELLKSFLHG